MASITDRLCTFKSNNPTPPQCRMLVHGGFGLHITTDEYITNNTLETVNGTTLAENHETCLKDIAYETETGEARFIPMCRAQALQAKTFVELYYDKKYKDILLVPDTRPSKFLNGGVLNFSVSSISCGEPVTNYRIAKNTGAPYENASNRHKLPLAKSNVAVKSLLVNVSGMSSEGEDNGYVDITTTIGDTLINNDKVKTLTILEFANLNALFTGDGEIPLFLLYQSTLRSVGSHYLGVKSLQSTDYTNKKVYIILPF